MPGIMACPVTEVIVKTVPEILPTAVTVVTVPVPPGLITGGLVTVPPVPPTLPPVAVVFQGAELGVTSPTGGVLTTPGK